MAMTLHKSITIAVLAAGFALGSLSAATAHHGDVSEHSTTKGKTIGEIERLERQITADLNRKQAQGQQLALATPAPMNQVMPAPMSEMPAAMPSIPMPNNEQAPAEAEGEDAPNL